MHLVTVVGSAARLTRLSTRDKITEKLRTRVHERVLFNAAQRAARATGQPVPPPSRPWAAELRTWAYQGMTCDWCIGVWWCAATTAIHYRWGKRSVVEGGLTALAAAYALGWLVEHESPEPAIVLNDHAA